MRLWISNVSPTCFSSVCSGFSEVIGSWKTIAMRLPRISRSRAGAAPTNSSPAKRMLLSGVWAAAGYGSSCRIDSAVTDFPEPLSPTRANVSPRSSANDACLTASTAGAPRQPPKVTLRSRISSRLIATLGPPASRRHAGATPAVPHGKPQRGSSDNLARVERVAHRFADEDQQAQHDREHDKGGDAEPRRLQVRLALGQQFAQ